MLLLEIFWTFFVIGMFTFGGGYAIMSLIQAQVVFGKAWITEETFIDIVAISQMTPGPVGLNCSTYVGYEVMRAAGYGQALSVTGSLIASLAIVLPSFLIVLAIAKAYAKFHENTLFKGAMSALRPAVVGLIGAAALVMIFRISLGGGTPAFTLIRENFPDWKSWALFAAAFVASWRFKADPVVILLAGAVLGLFLY
ncbi:MAG: chromate transporter [Bacteroidales bacterium]|nr:chromate transporter [Bacteroidales bacterium]